MPRRPTTPVAVTREQVLAFRRAVNDLDARLPAGRRSLRAAARAGLQDSMPRAALLSLHARVAGVRSDAWTDPALVQVWGPRHHTYVIAARDRAVFTLGRLPDDVAGRERAGTLADRLRDELGGATRDYGDVGAALGVHPNALRYAAATGTVLIRWDGARRPLVRSVPAPEVDPADARRELARRYLHAFGPAGAGDFAWWAGIPARAAADTFDALRRSLVPVRTDAGDGWLLARDEAALREHAEPSSGVRLLPSGDALFLAHGAQRELLVPEEARRRRLWTPRVWPGLLLVDGELRGTWRRAGGAVAVEPWGRLTRAQRAALHEAGAALPVPGDGPPAVTIQGDG